MGFFRTEDRVAELRRLVALNLPSSEIALRLSTKFGELVSRNAVIGKRARLTGPEPMKKRRRIIKNEVMEVDEPAELPTTVAEILAHAVPLLELENHHCRWPVAMDPYLACGHPSADVAERRPYCATHYARSVGNGTPSERRALKLTGNMRAG
jgi:hypothetical protein